MFKLSIGEFCNRLKRVLDLSKTLIQDKPKRIFGQQAAKDSNRISKHH